MNQRWKRWDTNPKIYVRCFHMTLLAIWKVFYYYYYHHLWYLPNNQYFLYLICTCFINWLFSGSKGLRKPMKCYPTVMLFLWADSKLQVQNWKNIHSYWQIWKKIWIVFSNTLELLKGSCRHNIQKHLPVIQAFVHIQNMKIISVMLYHFYLP